MDAIETLMNEHRLIERVLDGLVVLASDVRRRGMTEASDLARFVRFVREFADAAHHGKEEDILFATMVEHGFPRHGGPIAVMLHEHDQGRGLVRILAQRAQQQEPWNDGDRQEIAEVALGYAQLLRAHIQKEDGVLYPMAEQHLPPDALAAVGEACERYEAHAGAHEELCALAEDLIQRYSPPLDPGEIPAHRFGCCG